MGVEKTRYDALADLFDGGSALPAACGPLPSNGSTNQKALGFACWYLKNPDKTFSQGPREITVRQAVQHFFGSQVEHGLFEHEPNSNEYHHLYSAPGWAIYDRALRTGDAGTAEVLATWLRNDIASAVLFAVREDGTLKTAAPGARSSRIHSLSRDIGLQLQLDFPLSRHRGHGWWDYQRNRESLGAFIHAGRRSVLSPAERTAAKSWVKDRSLKPAFRSLIAPLRYRSRLRIVDTERGWYAYFPLLEDCWDNAQPATSVAGAQVHRLRAKSDEPKKHFWHKSRPVTTEEEGDRLVARGMGQRGAVNVPLSEWTDSIPIPGGEKRRVIEIGPEAVSIDGALVEGGGGAGPAPPEPPTPPLMSEDTAALYGDLGERIGERRVAEAAEQWAEVRAAMDDQRRLLERLTGALRL